MLNLHSVNESSTIRLLPKWRGVAYKNSRFSQVGPVTSIASAQQNRIHYNTDATPLGGEQAVNRRHASRLSEQIFNRCRKPAGFSLTAKCTVPS
jgi:hypothetical protein